MPGCRGSSATRRRVRRAGAGPILRQSLTFEGSTQTFDLRTTAGEFPPPQPATRPRPTSDNLTHVSEISATEAARNFADLLDAIEHRGEHFTIVRRGKAIAHLEPVSSGRGSDVKRMLSDHPADSSWSDDLAAVREIIELQHRP